MTDNTERFDSWALRQEAEHLAWVVMNEYDQDELDAWSAALEQIDGHGWVIYTYKAIRVCAENDYSEAEDTVMALDPRGYSFSDYASALVREMLFNEVLTILNDNGVEI